MILKVRRHALPARLAISVALLLAPLTLSGCTYGPPTWHHHVMNAMAQPREHRFAVVILSTQARAPQGLTAFPDGGKALVLRQTAKLWLCDPEEGTSRLMSRIERPKGVRSEYSAWIVAWDSAGDYRSIYIDVRGREGETSDTKVLRWLLKVEVGPDTSRAVAVSYIPNTVERPRGAGPLRGGRELQVGAGDTMSVLTDTDPTWRPRFAIDRESGNVVPLARLAPADSIRP